MDKPKQTELNSRKPLDPFVKEDQKDLTNTMFSRTANNKSWTSKNNTFSNPSSLSSKQAAPKATNKIGNRKVLNFHDQAISDRIQINQPKHQTAQINQISDFKILDFKNLDQIISNQQSSSKQSNIDQYSCQLCGLDLYEPGRYNFHLSKIHKIDRRINYIQCYVTGCEEKFKKRMELVDHLNNFHKLKIKILRKIVQNLDEFSKWKNEIEQKTGYQWVQNNKFHLNNRLRTTFICNRTATNGIKVYSLHGLTTINNHSSLCLSSIKITENDDKTFFIEFVETHNHDE